MNREGVCSTCGQWTSEGRKILTLQARDNPIFKTDLSRPLSEIVRELRNSFVSNRGTITDVYRAFPVWEDRLRDVEGLLTCGLVTLYSVLKDMNEVENHGKDSRLEM